MDAFETLIPEDFCGRRYLLGNASLLYDDDGATEGFDRLLASTGANAGIERRKTICAFR